jgi:hypothetical protein
VRALLAVLLALLGVGCTAATPSPVVGLVDRTGNTLCSAFAVAPRELVTAAHCLRMDPIRFERRAPIAFGYEVAKPVRVNRDQDWAVLSTDADLPTLPVARPHHGLVSVLAAKPGWQSSTGRLLESFFAGFAADGSDVRRWSAELDVNPGWSGSPVVQDGAAVGVLQTCRGANWPAKQCARPGFVTFFPIAEVL